MAAKHRKLVFVGFESFIRPSRKQVVNTEVKVEHVDRKHPSAAESAGPEF